MASNTFKLTLYLLTLFIFGSHVQAEPHNLPSNIKVISTNLTLKESKGDRRAFIAEYIPKNETFDNWTTMFAVRFVDGKEQDPKAAAQNTARNINLRKEKGDMLANSMVMESPDKKSVVVDFLISDKDLIEHNVWRFFKSDGGLVSYQIARRTYGKDKSTEFITSIKTRRTEILNEIIRKDLPIPTLK